MTPQPEAVGKGRPRLDPDPRVRAAILSAAVAIVREEGVRSFGVSQLLARAQLSTRAFYRHFGSKDELVAAMFLDMARREMQRLERSMAGLDPVRAVVAWIDARLDLAFDPQLGSDLRQLSVEAQSQMFAAPELVGPAYAEMLRPLVDQLENGSRLGLFGALDPAAEALSIQGVVWANVERQWATAGQTGGQIGGRVRNQIRGRVQRFCLRGLGVADPAIAEVLASNAPAGRNRKA